jgi:uncharacterized protein YutE (UPF0331/DUF86 family)
VNAAWRCIPNREGFRLAGEHQILSGDLAASLEKAAGMRNVLVHLYEQISREALRGSIEPAIAAFSAFVAAIEARLDGRAE